MRNLEKELTDDSIIREKVLDDIYAQKLYAALCNISWYTEAPDDHWNCSWRYAGGLVAQIRFQGEDYLHFYCSGIGQGTSEGTVDSEIETDLARIGWKWEKIK